MSILVQILEPWTLLIYGILVAETVSLVLQTNDALVAPLLRLKDNNCHVEESEKVLKKKEKFSELIILYEKKGLHEKGRGQIS